ncbi:hypothetical protein [Streptomyces sp. 3213.3]|uniref:hypothetical protein n=1 Tax=Streptomyces sp. 3213.3 TaxID=1855348 RepID=UPI001F401553|nr:hypothetical protein [Streptomyces sp. 3213.3]
MALLVIGGVVSCLDRATLSVANTTIAGEFGLNATEMGLQVQVDSDTARERVRARGCARDRSKLADRDTFRKTAEANACRWSEGRRLVFDNRADGITADEVARAPAGLS